MNKNINDMFKNSKQFVCLTNNIKPVNFLFMSDDFKDDAKRVEQQYLLLGMKAPEFQRAVDIKSQDWTNWKKRGIPKRKLELVSDVIGKPVDWILTGKDNHTENQAIRQTLPRPALPPGPEFVPVHYGSFRLQAGVSGFSVDYQDEDYEPLFFRESWLLRERLKAENLTARKISGDSMAPGLNHDDTVLIDRSKNEPVDGKVFAVNYEGELVIKRLVRDAGQWWLASDNPDKTRYPNKLCSGDLCLIIGQCVHKQSTMI